MCNIWEFASIHLDPATRYYCASSSATCGSHVWGPFSVPHSALLLVCPKERECASGTFQGKYGKQEVRECMYGRGLGGRAAGCWPLPCFSVILAGFHSKSRAESWATLSYTTASQAPRAQAIWRATLPKLSFMCFI